VSNELAAPSPEDFCKFVEAYFNGQGMAWTRDDKSKANHTVYRVPGHHRNVSVPRNKDPMRLGTLKGCLADMDLGLDDYRDWAGTPDKLKQYVKEVKRGLADNR